MILLSYCPYSGPVDYTMCHHLLLYRVNLKIRMLTDMIGVTVLTKLQYQLRSPTSQPSEGIIPLNSLVTTLSNGGFRFVTV